MTWHTVFLLVLIIFGICDESCARNYKYSKDDVITLPENQITTEKIETYNSTKGKVNITVYYETLCPASMDFIVLELKPTVEQLSSHLDVHLIPYGFAETTFYHNRYEFDCQHGPLECFGNRLHACTLDSMQNRTQAVLFNACLVEHDRHNINSEKDYISTLNWCGLKLRVLINEIWECMNSSRGDLLLKGHGEVTDAESPPVVPYILLNGDNTRQDEATMNLLGVVCSLLKPTPKACPDNDDDHYDTVV